VELEDNSISDENAGVRPSDEYSNDYDSEDKSGSGS